MQSSALVHPEKRLMSNQMCDAQDQMNYCNSGSSLSPGTSTIIAASIEQAQLESKNTIGALARSGYRGRFYGHQPVNDDIEKDSITNSDTTRDLNIINRADQRNKKLSWQHDDYQVN